MRKAARELFEAQVGFDDPLEILLACHRRIEKQLETLKRLRVHVEAHGVDAEASIAAQAVLHYFRKAAANHHDDEELDLFPLLEARITDPGDTSRFKILRETLAKEHRVLESAWMRLRKPLEGIAEGLTRALPAGEVHDFVSAYARHIQVEEEILQELFDRWLDGTDRAALGRSMGARRTRPQPG